MTQAELIQFIYDAETAWLNQCNQLLIAERKGANDIPQRFLRCNLTLAMINSLKRYLPAGTVIQIGAGAGANILFDGFFGTLGGNADDIPVSFDRNVSVFAGTVNGYGISSTAAVASIAADVNGGTLYTATENYPYLLLAEPDGTTDTGNVTTALSAYDQLSTTPAFTISILDVSTFHLKGFSSLGQDNYDFFYDGDFAFLMMQNSVTGENFVGPIGNGAPPFEFGGYVVNGANTDQSYVLDMTLGEIWYFVRVGAGSGQRVGSFTPASTRVDGVYKAGDTSIYWVAGGNYLKMLGSFPYTFVVSTSPSIPDDEFLVINTVSGNIYSFSSGSPTLTLVAMSGALSVTTLAYNIAGRIGYYNSQYFIPEDGTRIIHITDTSFADVSTIDLDNFDIPSVDPAATIVGVNMFGDAMYIQMTDGKYVVARPSGVLNSLGADDIALLCSSGNDASKTALGTTSLGAAYTIESIAADSSSTAFTGGTPDIVWTSADNCYSDTNADKMAENIRITLRMGCGVQTTDPSENPTGATTRLLQTVSGIDIATVLGLYIQTVS